MASAWYNQGKVAVMNHTVDLLADTIKVMLLNASYTFSAAHQFVSAVDANELSGAGYAGGFGGSGRLALAGKTVTAAGGGAVFNASGLLWPAISAGTAAWAVLIKEIANDAASLLIAAMDINPDVLTNSGDFTLSWNAGGILQIS
jgi:hypothetical protein